MKRLIATSIGILLLLQAVSFGQDHSSEDLLEMSLDDLLNMEVSSVSKKAERLQDVASSLYVLTSEDIMNSGATSLHEALMMVPGYWGTQTEYSQVSPVIRNSPVANGSRGTVSYLLDGTPIIDNMSSVMTFANFDVPLDEIDRIEVIRGSGGTVYGANSATGVVNIFTKNPENVDGFSMRADGASPVYGNFSAKGGGQVGEKLYVSAYGRVRTFDGYGLMPEFEGSTVTVPNGATGTDTTIANGFTSDFNKSTYYSGGLKGAWELSEKSKLSFSGHYNVGNQISYTAYEVEMTLLDGQDVLVQTDVSRNRIVGNLQLDHNFSDQHSLFARVSTNRESNFIEMMGGYEVDNSIIDFEVQDNFSVGSAHDFSVGANYRSVKFDVHDINSADALVYKDPQTRKALTGAFLQDKVGLLDGKLNLLMGIKAENYKLINDDYYFSPMAKFSYIPTQSFTLWGGFTQSYTTPGFNNTNVDLLFLQTLSDETVLGVATQGVYTQVYDATYAGVIAGGGTLATAETTAAAAAAAYVASVEGQGVIAGAAAGLSASLPDNIGVINGSSTVPTKYQTWELGFRANVNRIWSLESNLYFSKITDGVAPTPGTMLDDYESPITPGRYADYYLYGNYMKGETYGAESMVRVLPTRGVKLEFAHTFTHATWEYQENPDFDINDPSVIAADEVDMTPDVPAMPKHIWKVRGHFQLPNSVSVNMGLVHASTFSTESTYDYVNQRYVGILGGNGTAVSTKQNRTIVNLKVEKKFMQGRMGVYAFGNDIFNDGMIANTNSLTNATLSKIGAKFGAGISMDF